MEYWRFTRQCLCADEVGYGRFIADIVVLTKKDYIHEIEVKVAKSDLCTLELKKTKHLNMTNKWFPHYFSFAVPTELIEEALKIISQLNPKYGLIEIDNSFNHLTIRKSPSRLHNNIERLPEWKQRIIYRLNSALIGYMKRVHLKEVNNNVIKEDLDGIS